ncbi:MAG: hypothetical protein HPY53_07355 [Brevinematales bacterium]|nr:hypothetical protein [Brevinematales bacterium]
MKVITDGYQIDFTDAIYAFVFDEKDITKTTFHGAPMKAIDVIAELANEYLFVEIKEYDKPEEFDESVDDTDEMVNKARHDQFRWLKNYLKYKYRDSFLYRFAENKVSKPIHYLCLLNFDNALNMKMAKSLRAELPVGKASRNWNTEISKSCQVLNLIAWNRSFPKWPAKKL